MGGCDCNIFAALICIFWQSVNGGKRLKVWMAALITIFCFAGGIGLLLEWNKSKKRIFLIGAIVVFVVLAMCIFYCAAALLLVGGID